MDNRPALSRQPPPEAWDHADLLRTAAETLRYIAREVPRGPWRWGEPDLGDGEPAPVSYTHLTLPTTPYV